jgi:hypothetical protein
MEVREPEIAYGLQNMQVEVLRNRLIDIISRLSDVHLLEKCERILNPRAKSKSLYRTSPFIESLVLKGGDKVPENVNSIDSLLDEKYKL